MSNAGFIYTYVILWNSWGGSIAQKLTWYSSSLFFSIREMRVNLVDTKKWNKNRNKMWRWKQSWQLSGCPPICPPRLSTSLSFSFLCVRMCKIILIQMFVSRWKKKRRPSPDTIEKKKCYTTNPPPPPYILKLVPGSHSRFRGASKKIFFFFAINSKTILNVHFISFLGIHLTSPHAVHYWKRGKKRREKMRTF